MALFFLVRRREEDKKCDAVLLGYILALLGRHAVKLTAECSAYSQVQASADNKDSHPSENNII